MLCPVSTGGLAGGSFPFAEFRGGLPLRFRSGAPFPLVSLFRPLRTVFPSPPPPYLLSSVKRLGAVQDNLVFSAGPPPIALLPRASPQGVLLASFLGFNVYSLLPEFFSRQVEPPPLSLFVMHIRLTPCHFPLPPPPLEVFLPPVIVCTWSVLRPTTPEVSALILFFVPLPWLGCSF